MNTIEITSVGQASAWFQKHPKAIREAAELLNIAPAYIINGTAHYTPTQLEQIAEHLNQAILQNPKPLT